MFFPIEIDNSSIDLTAFLPTAFCIFFKLLGPREISWPGLESNESKKFFLIAPAVSF
jgi:hypothetical protein